MSGVLIIKVSLRGYGRNIFTTHIYVLTKISSRHARLLSDIVENIAQNFVLNYVICLSYIILKLYTHKFMHVSKFYGSGHRTVLPHPVPRSNVGQLALLECSVK